MIAYLDLPSGLSGDMFLGCLVDAGWPLEALQATLSLLPLPTGSWSVRAETVHRGPLRATLVTVATAEAHHHRGLAEIEALIETADLPPSVRAGAIGVFRRLAQAEARVHGVPVEQVHFHEVGALDAIVDIVGAMAGLHALGIEALYASAVPLGPGWVETAHGRLPLPAPATLELLAEVGAPTRPAPGPGELVTPTGAALLAQFARFGQPALRLQRIGYGAGQRDFPWPNVARLWLGEPADEPAPSPVVQIETNIDDMNPELYPAAVQRLLAAGALDAWLTPVQMKKGRPGVVLSVLAPADREADLAALILRETTTLGVRVHAVRRHEAGRELRTVETPYGRVRVKLKRLGEAVWGAAPEYEDCRQRAESHGVPVRLVYEAAQAAAHALCDHGLAERAGGPAPSWDVTS
ncbi:MAG: nickel pincer cofactor biosynthesis protein LarC [Caldilineales bacterium]|nr:nickel pincer cofactor biosynthesis protein LarC [Caldilineales bacterium]